MKLLLAKLFVALSLAGSALTFGVFTPKPTVPVSALNRFETAQMQTVLLRTEDGGQGSGVVVKRTNPSGEVRFFVWTAAHVVEGFTDIEVVRIGRENGTRIECELTWCAVVIAVSKEMDVALLWVHIPSEFVMPVEFEFNLPRVGDPIIHIGNYYGEAYDGSVAVGIVSMIGVHPRTFPDWPWLVLDQTDALVVPGSSGGGIFDANGRVLGIVVGLHTPGIGLYVPVRELLKWSEVSGTTWALKLDWCPADDALLPHS